MHIFDTNLPKESSTTGLNGQFLHFQLLIDVLLRLKPQPTDRTELISFCQEQCQDGILQEFEENYSSNQAIWWYTRESFLYKILNKALRTENINLLFLFRFFLQDIEVQLQANQYPSSIRVYRCQSISNEELESLKNSIGQFISMNSFLSTSFHRERALSFLHPLSNHQQILFIIDADPSMKNIKPFSDITQQSYFPDEGEVLFMLGSIFRIIQIDFEEDYLWIIRMNLCSNEEHQLKSIFDYMRKQFGDEQSNLLAFGKVLWTMGKFDQAEKYFLRLLNELSEDDPLISYCCRALGNVADDKGDEQNSLKWHMKAIDQMKKTDDSNASILAESYNSIGCVYDTKGDYKRAVEFYKKALTIWKEIYGDEHLNIAVCLNNLACVYAEREEYSKALEYYEKVLAIREKHLPMNHSDRGATHNNIGEIYRRIGRYQCALEHLNIANEIYHLSLPSDHPDRAEVLMNIGLVHQNLHDHQQALFFYTKASKIYHQTLQSNHPSARKIDRLLSQLQTSSFSE